MKQFIFPSRLLLFALLLLGVFTLESCEKDEDSGPGIGLNFTGKSKQYPLVAIAGSGTNGTVTFMEKKDNITLVVVRMNSTVPGEFYPSHIHANNALDGGDIVIDLNPVDGSRGFSETEVTTQNNGQAISYAQLLEFNGYVNVHKSAAELQTILSQGDIGGNELTATKTYTLDSLGTNGMKGTATFAKRASGSTLVTINLAKEMAGVMHPAHIHANSATETGGIVISLKDVDGATGMSKTNVTKLDAAAGGTPITYDQLMDYDGYLNVHKSMAELANVISQSDIGGNELTSDSKTYNLATVAVPGVSGTAKFDKRKNGNTLITLALKGTMAGGMHPAHIHANSAAEGGGIVISLKDVDGATGMSKTNVEKLDGATGTAIDYDSLLSFDGYINVHESMANLGTLLAQGDIGGNELTGNAKDYALSPISGSSGSARFAERKNGNTLVTLKLASSAGMHPAHIHANSAAEGGVIVISLKDVDGATGMSMTNVRKLDAATGDTRITYAELLDFDGYINVHESMANLGTLLAQGDIGGNELTGMSKTYTLLQKDVPGIYGSAKFEERKNGYTLITLDLEGTTAGGIHPAHIHANAAAEGGAIVISLQNVDGATGISKTNVEKLDGETGAAITYAKLLTYDGYINVHLSEAALTTIVAQGNVGSNAL